MSSLKDLASLIMVPSLYKDGRLDTVKPLGNGILHPDSTGNNDGTDGSTPAEGNFTFSRGSNLAATRVDVNGLIEKGRENLLVQSNQFDTTWSKPNSTLAQGFSGYDGSNNAWKWSSTAAGTTQLSQGTSGVSGIRTLSLYAKAGSRDVFSIWVGTGIDFNLTTGQTAGHANASMESVGNGWWRCSYFNDYGTLNPYYVASSAGEFIYIMNAQAEQGLVATDYIETGTSAAQSGILEDMPRLDYSGGASCPSLLLEPSRTNGLPQSEYFNAWTVLNDVAITANSITSPEGLLNGSLMAASGVGATARSVRQGSQSTSTDIKTMSVYAKANASNYIQLYHSGEVQAYANFDLSSGAVGTSGTNATADIEPMGNDWYRCIATFDSVGNFGSSVYVGFATSSSAPYGGGSVSDTSSVYIFGAQYEVGSYPTSYIPTYGSSVTRSKEGANLTSLSGVFGSSASTAFVEIDVPPSGSLSPTGVWTLTAATNTSNFVSICQFDSGITTPRVALYIGGVAIIDQYLSAPLSEGTHKVCFVYEDGRQKLFIDGVEELSLTASFNYVEFTKLSINDAAWALGNNGGPYSNKQTLVFPTALTDSECIALTTL